ncbi:MAG: hypothetical protein KDE55_19700 [Novosphingobium sp.]|nr:hypothetical protein [Novosphingobium sp.]
MKKSGSKRYWIALPILFSMVSTFPLVRENLDETARWQVWYFQTGMVAMLTWIWVVDWTARLWARFKGPDAQPDQA